MPNLTHPPTRARLIDALRLDLKEQSGRATEAARKAAIALHPRIAALRAQAEEASDV